MQGMTKQRAVIAIAFLSILVLAGVMRITSATNTIVDRPIRNDAKDYVAYSFNWQNSNIYSRQVTWVPGHMPDRIVSDALRPPGYPAFLRLFLSGIPDLTFVRSVMLGQAWLGIVTVALVFGLARLMLGPIAALFAMLLTAISPHLIVMENYLLSETLYTTLLVAAIAAGVLALRRPDSPRTLASATSNGGILALCALVRPTLEHIPLLILLGTCIAPGLRVYRKHALCGMIAFALIMAPWWVRNLDAIGQISDSSLMINTLHHGSYPGFMYEGDPKTLGDPYRFDPHSRDAEASLGAVLTDILHKFTQQPITYLGWYLVGKIKFFFNWDIVDGFGDIFTYAEFETPYYANRLFLLTRALMFGLHWPLVIAGLLGAGLVWTRFAKFTVDGWKVLAMRWLSVVLLYAIALHMIGAPFPRYSIPFRPLLYVMAAFTVAACAGWIKTHRRSASGSAG